MEKKIVLSLACLLIGIGLAIAQTPKTVTGLVIFEEDNQPIVGASVLIKGTNQGAVTDLDGKFTLTNVPGLYGKNTENNLRRHADDRGEYKKRNDENRDETGC